MQVRQPDRLRDDRAVGAAEEGPTIQTVKDAPAQDGLASMMIRCVITTLNDDDDHLMPALAAGALGHILKDQPRMVPIRQQRLIRLSTGERRLRCNSLWAVGATNVTRSASRTDAATRS
jgi:hypothetical protein